MLPFNEAWTGSTLHRRPDTLVDQVEHAELPSVMGPALDEVVRPDVVLPLRPQTDARPVVQPKPSFLRLLLRDLQPLPPPDPLDPLHVHRPAGIPKQGGNAAVAVAPILGGERDDISGQRLFISPPARHFPLGGAMLAEHPAGQAFRNAELLPDMVDATAAAGGA